MPLNPRVFFRKVHRWGAVVAAAPFLLVLVTGCLLQLKKEIAWVQPPTKKGTGNEPTAPFDAVLTAVKGVPEARVHGWADIERMDVRPKDGVVKVQCKNRYEVQVDFQTAQVLQVEYRRSDLIESLHDGSFFHDSFKVYVFFPVALVVVTLWATGMYLFVLPLAVCWRRKRPAPDAPGPK
ncbi:PepSY domain-containing protein [Gemmata sp. JC673]|uniref:PepSY domain-containing protein n=1 Tax=Gemmata algarum TaxID=2975278 RepID=A0ABU5F7W8_9BACT|nr:PepSY-associated TM helix domain-containing protein [Gemmata algarum]MDY3562438.1 PepSY domain-containing protein [Gemmata algarum]